MSEDMQFRIRMTVGLFGWAMCMIYGKEWLSHFDFYRELQASMPEVGVFSWEFAALALIVLTMMIYLCIPVKVISDSGVI